MPPQDYYDQSNIGDANTTGTFWEDLPADAQPNQTGRVDLGNGAYATYGPDGRLLGGGSGPGAVQASGASIPIPKAGDRAGIRNWVVATANANGRPEIAANPDYYVDRIFEKGGDVGDGKWWGENIRGGGEMGGGGAAGSLGSAMGGGGDLLAPYTQQFSAPIGTDDPGFQFAVQQGQQGIERSAASKGTLLTGGTLKDLAAYTTGAALQDYAGAYNRALSTFGTNYDIFRNNQNDPFQKLYSTTGLGLQAAGAYSNSLGNNTSAYNNVGLTGANNIGGLLTDKASVGANSTANQYNQYGQALGSLVNAGQQTGWFRRPNTAGANMGIGAG